MSSFLGRLSQAVIDGDSDATVELVSKGIAENLEPLTMFESLRTGIREVGDRFGRGDAFITDLIASAEAMKTGTRVLEPLIMNRRAEITVTGTVVMGTVEGDIHDIGKNMVTVMLRAEGFEVDDLGVDVPSESFVESVRKEHADLVGMSALLTSTLPAQPKVIEALTAAGLRRNVKVMVGGATVTHEWSEKIGADGYAPDAALAVQKARELLRGSTSDQNS